MTYWQHAPEGVQERLIELAELFAGCRAIYFDLVDEQHWQPAAGSAAAHEKGVLPLAENLPAGEFRPSGFYRVVDVIASYLQVAAGHLGSSFGR